MPPTEALPHVHIVAEARQNASDKKMYCRCRLNSAESVGRLMAMLVAMATCLIAFEGRRDGAQGIKPKGKEPGLPGRPSAGGDAASASTAHAIMFAKFSVLHLATNLTEGLAEGPRFREPDHLGDAAGILYFSDLGPFLLSTPTRSCMGRRRTNLLKVRRTAVLSVFVSE